jgi:tRNA (guanine-N7-)-methyltransferase
MAKNKLRRFADMKSMDFVFEPDLREAMTQDFHLKGKWNKSFFKNDQPIVLELGCGKGEYTVGMGEMFPDKNFIGVDIKGARIWDGADKVRENKFKNIGFIRIKIDFIDAFFAENEVDEIWLTFSDPQPQKPNKRLSSKVFIDKYLKFLKPGGIIHLKTDSDLLFESTLEVVNTHNFSLGYKSWDIYANMENDFDKEFQKVLAIQTNYEQIFGEKGFKIKYCNFQIN